jgi:hypothetical protein
MPVIMKGAEVGFLRLRFFIAQSLVECGTRSCRKVGGNWCSGISSGMKVSRHAARSMH